MEAAGFSEAFVPLTRRPLVVTAVSASYLTVLVVVPQNSGFPIEGHWEAFGRVCVRKGKCPSGALC